ncbi:hypothetical protein MtrunA17_Chr4g0000871 [Medicago truncatula]|uniref:Uncharacterized protein n=1 Tax=Medicago truncatula TaxID=3880 RepID=A0A396I281_MEDTR|nr:hypothetical protein MtrunA17_Chr4g0000871 [Medicago truncatula]
MKLTLIVVHYLNCFEPSLFSTITLSQPLFLSSHFEEKRASLLIMADFEEQQRKIDDAMAFLVRRQFCAEIYTADNINRAGFTTNQFMKHMQVLTCIEEADELVQVLELGSDDGKFWISPETCKLAQLVRFVGWLKTYKGKTACQWLDTLGSSE